MPTGSENVCFQEGVDRKSLAHGQNGEIDPFRTSGTNGGRTSNAGFGHHGAGEALSETVGLIALVFRIVCNSAIRL